ncbi:unnamed protein product [Sphagnum jensenii]|uniref:Uncharacterized protein n=1 Tax=Sphagnum jensenii TaxID=128206 RepID=A0ABP0X2Z5_9BRYO
MGERVLCSSTSCGACEHSSGVVTIEFVNSCLDSSAGLCFSGAFFVILRSARNRDSFAPSSADGIAAVS